MSLVSRTGSNLIAEASKCFATDPEIAEVHLQTIRKLAPTFMDQLKEKEVELEKKTEELKGRETSLEWQINSKEREQDNLRSRIRSLEVDISRHEAVLSEYRDDLRRAESNKREAESKKDAAIVGTVAGGVGAVALGILFPPSLFVTVPAVATAGTISISEANDHIRRCKSSISSVESSISSVRSDIQRVHGQISSLSSDISSLKTQKNSLYAERGKLRNTIVFLQQAVTYFGELQVASEGGKQKTNLLLKLVNMANEKKSYKILTSKGGATVAHSFAEAWQKVEEKIADDREGFLNIDIDSSRMLN